MREVLVTNPSLIGTTIRDPNTGGIGSGAALDKATASMPHSLGEDGTEDSAKIREEAGEILSAEEIANRRKAHAAERTLAAAQPEHPELGKNVDVLTGGASPSASAPQPVRPDPIVLDPPPSSTTDV